jgi:hypothetical protein
MLFTYTVPEVGVRYPVITFRVVDFPAPLAPKNPIISPLTISRNSMEMLKL